MVILYSLNNHWRNNPQIMRDYAMVRFQFSRLSKCAMKIKI
nr:MAG TPA: hypothetical protein [Caudoviricetes sp.]